MQRHVSLLRDRLPVLLALALTACQAPGQLPAARPPAQASDTKTPPLAGQYRLQALDEPLDVVVRYRADRQARARALAQQVRQLRLARAEILRSGSLTQRDALLRALRQDPAVAWAEPDYRFAMSESNDPQLPKQWAIPTIRAEQAWPQAQASGVTVAVLDTGVDQRHPDLQGQIVAGSDLVDGDRDPQDQQGHGTHVAGTIAARLNNGVGVAGVAPQAKILAIRVLDAQGSGAMSDIADGVLAAVDAGARVINLSLGGSSDGQTLRAAIERAQQAGVLVVAAAGNEGSESLSYPAAYPGVVSVGASTAKDTRASFSNFGRWVQIAAPGDRILSTQLGGGYVSLSGTSMASPHVAAVAAQVRALRPDWGLAQVRSTLLSTGQPVRGFEANPALRRLDAWAAVQAASGSPTPLPTTEPSPSPLPTPESPRPTPPAQEPAPSPSPVAPRPTPVVRPTAPPEPDLRLEAIRAMASGTRARIRWRTNLPARGEVRYGEGAELEQRSPTEGGQPRRQQQVRLAGLKPWTIYQYRVHAVSPAGQEVVGPLESFRTGW
ncbi:MAG: S8 family serine peptidase [Candidatus Sericytochromatia bacterium]|nr:S8 family serine peptidase [Candidatus Sericytochromatia bacterium]